MTRKNNTQRLESRPDQCIEMVLKEPRDFQKVLGTQRAIALKFTGYMQEGKDSVEHTHLYLLGKPDFEWTGEFRFKVYERPLYRVMVNNTKGAVLSVDVGVTREQALDALEQYRRDMRLSEQTLLSGSELAAAEDIGIAAMEGHEMVLNPSSDDDLRQFVSSYCEGKVFTSENVPVDLVPMVFMPLALGGLALPEEVRVQVALKMPPDPGPEEGEPEPEPEVDPLPDLPERPISPEESQLWETLNFDLLALRRSNTVANEVRRNLWLERKRLAELDKDNWAKKHAFYKHAWGAAYKQYLKDLGCVWESTDAYALPRGVNGYPIFASCRFMCKTDYVRAGAAIKREMEHKKNMVI